VPKHYHATHSILGFMGPTIVFSSSFFAKFGQISKKKKEKGKL
jgi:hypothetical protein